MNFTASNCVILAIMCVVPQWGARHLGAHTYIILRMNRERWFQIRIHVSKIPGIGRFLHKITVVLRKKMRFYVTLHEFT